MENKALCEICGEGHVTAQTRSVETDYKGTKALLPMHYQQCDTCTSDYAGMAESKLNKRIVMAFRKQVDGLLPGEEITALRKQYKLTQAQAAKLFGGGPVAFSKYENDDVAQSEAMDRLLRLVRRSPAVFDALVDETGLTEELQRPPEASAARFNRFSLVRINSSPQDATDCRYNPKEFRKFSVVSEGMSWQAK